MADATRVWGAFDQSALDAEYNAAATVPSLDAYLERYASESARVRAAHECSVGVRYGPGEREVLDAFPATHAGAPLLICLHGGYWRRLSKDDFSFFAEPFVRAGAAVVVPSYSLAPGARLDEIVRQARDVGAWCYENAGSLRADSNRVFASGHSAGAQLAAMLAATAWHLRGLPNDLVKGVCGISGLYELEPVRRSYVNEWLRLDPAEAERNSPILRMPRTTIPLLAAVGALETSEFRRQTRDVANVWQMAGMPAEARVLDGLNHYSIVLDVLDGGSELGAAMRRWIGI
jgi:arylformamidase